MRADDDGELQCTALRSPTGCSQVSWCVIPGSNWPSPRARWAGCPTSSANGPHLADEQRNCSHRSVLQETTEQLYVGSCLACFFEDDFGLGVRDTIGIDHITFESDYPHQDSSWPNTYADFCRAVAGLPIEDIYKIARGNAIRMLDLDPEPPPAEGRG